MEILIYDLDDLSNTYSGLFQQSLDACGMVQHVNEPTHHQGHTLDILVTREANSLIGNINVMDPMLCNEDNVVIKDHYAILATLNVDKPMSESKVIRYRKLRDIDIDQFQRDIILTPQLNNCNLPMNTLVCNLDTSLSSLLDKHAPLCKKTIKIRKRALWNNSEIQCAKRERRRLERKWRKSHNNTLYCKEFKQQCITVNKLLHKNRVDYYSNKLTIFYNLLTSNSYFPLIQKPTRTVKTSASLIDNIYTNYSLDKCSCGILCTDVSDHFPVFCVIDCTKVSDKPKTVTKRRFTEKNIAKFCRYLGRVEWDNIFNNNDAQDAFTILQRVIDQLMDDIFPEQTITMTYKTRHPWLSPELKAAIKTRNSMSNLCKQNPGNIQLHKEYKRYRNNITAQVKNAQINYQSNELDIVKDDISKTWNVLKMILGLNFRSNISNLTLVINDEVISDNLKIANAFNDYFVSIGAELSKNITSTIDPLSFVTPIQNSMFMPELSEHEVKTVILDLNNSAAGWDNFPTFVAKKCVDGYLTPMTKIINKSISQGIFPSELKLARVIPIFKSNDKQNISNYRPISILTFFSKVFEKILHNNIFKFMERNKTINENQFGFRKGHGTQHAIISLIDKIGKSVDSGDIGINMFLDLKKAFDTVSHSIVFKKTKCLWYQRQPLKVM